MGAILLCVKHGMLTFGGRGRFGRHISVVAAAVKVLMFDRTLGAEAFANPASKPVFPGRRSAAEISANNTM